MRGGWTCSTMLPNNMNKTIKTDGIISDFLENLDMPMLYTYPITLKHIYISPGHNYFGNRTQTPGEHPTFDVETVEVKAGFGLVGDRFYGKGENFDGHIPFFAWQVFHTARAECGAQLSASALWRRNVLTEGVNLNQ